MIGQAISNSRRAGGEVGELIGDLVIKPLTLAIMADI